MLSQHQTALQTDKKGSAKHRFFTSASKKGEADTSANEASAEINEVAEETEEKVVATPAELPRSTQMHTYQPHSLLNTGYESLASSGRFLWTGGTEMAHWCRGLIGMANKDRYIMTTLYDQAVEKDNITWFTLVSLPTSRMSGWLVQKGGQLIQKNACTMRMSEAMLEKIGWDTQIVTEIPHRFYVITGYQNVRRIGDYGEDKNNPDPAARHFTNFLNRIFGREDFLVNQLGDKAHAEKVILQSHMKDYDDMIEVARRRFHAVASSWNPNVSYQNQFSYMIVNTVAESLLKVPEIPMKFIPGLREVDKVFLDSSPNPARIKKSAQFMAQMNRELLEIKDGKNPIIDSVLKASQGESKAGFLAADLAHAHPDATNTGDMTSVQQGLLDRKGISLIAATSNITMALMGAIAKMSEQPEVRARLLEEIAELRKSEHISDENAPLSWESIKSLKYLDCIYHEILRLLSTIPILLRKTSQPYDLKVVDKAGKDKTYSIPPNSLLFAPLRSMHHDPRIWGANALQFDPSRFEGEKGIELRKKLLPFSSGRRQCPVRAPLMVEAIVKTLIVESSLFYDFQLDHELETVPTPVIETYWKREYFARVTPVTASSALKPKK